MLERNITIREIEEKDKASYLNLFNSESFMKDSWKEAEHDR